jgi:hypothetical protein
VRRTARFLAALSGCFVAAIVSAAAGTDGARTRAFAALPDWTGFWETQTAADLISGQLERDTRAAASSAPDPAPGPASGGPDPEEREFLRRTELLAPPPYNAQWSAASRSPAAGPPAVPPPTKACRFGFPFEMDNPTPDGTFEFLVTPEVTVMVFPNGEMRHVYTDGRAHPAARDLWPTRAGDSIGQWQGHTLIIDTVARTAGPILPVPIPGIADLGERAHFLERIRRVDANTMENEMTIEDPERLAHPWTVRIRYRRVVDLDRMIATDCIENDRNPVVNGRTIISDPARP